MLQESALTAHTLMAKKNCMITAGHHDTDQFKNLKGIGILIIQIWLISWP